MQFYPHSEAKERTTKKLATLNLGPADLLRVAASPPVQGEGESWHFPAPEAGLALPLRLPPRARVACEPAISQPGPEAQRWPALAE